MDVSRIGAISPNLINWRSLTAKEIIKYDNQGIEVPSQYLQWARDFRASLESNDETTYEMASSQKSDNQDVEKLNKSKNLDKVPDKKFDNLSKEELIEKENSTIPLDEKEVEKTSEEKPVQETNLTSAEKNGEVEEDDSAIKEENKDTEDDEKTVAQKKREELQEAGVSLRNQAISFTNDSKTSNDSVVQSARLIETTETSSINEIQQLDDYMSELLAKAEATQNELKNEVAKLNSDRGDKSVFAKINKYQSELEKYGTVAQNEVASSEISFKQMDALIGAQSDVILNADDFGSETINVGNDLLKTISSYNILHIVDFMIGRNAVSVGKNTFENAKSTDNLKNKATTTNSSNLSDAISYKSEIQSKTGVPPVNTAKILDNVNNDKLNNPKEKEEFKEEDKDIKTSQNDGTDVNDKMMTNLDEILKRKIRKGENINNT